MLFEKGQQTALTKPEFQLTANALQAYIKYGMNQLIQQHSKVYALAAICILMVVSIFLKNLFVYLSYRVLAPMRNYVMTKLRSDLYAKILELPIGFSRNSARAISLAA